MRKTTLRAFLTVIFIVLAGVMLMLADDHRRGKAERWANMALDYIEDAKDAAVTAFENARRGYKDAKDALNRAQ